MTTSEPVASDQSVKRAAVSGSLVVICGLAIACGWALAHGATTALAVLTVVRGSLYVPLCVAVWLGFFPPAWYRQRAAAHGAGASA